ncbi:MAG: phosphatase PAP2 family protein [Oligoflexus sp.]
MEEFIEIIRKVDVQWLTFVNHGLRHSWLDQAMILISERRFWITVTLFWLGLAVYKRNFRLVKHIFFAAAVLGLADFIAAQGLKPYFGRPRPCHTHSFVRIVQGCSGYFGFPSNHATNGMVVATIMIYLRSFSFGVFILMASIAVGFSRIYLGVHYPMDILFGFIFGSSVALLCIVIGQRFWRFLDRSPLGDRSLR